MKQNISTEPQIYGAFVRFDGMTWPRLGSTAKSPGDDDLAWRLRYAREHLTPEDLLVAASYIDAYRGLVTSGRLRREGIIRNLVAAEKAEVAAQEARIKERVGPSPAEQIAAAMTPVKVKRGRVRPAKVGRIK